MQPAGYGTSRARVVIKPRLMKMYEQNHYSVTEQTLNLKYRVFLTHLLVSE